jgi:hypothetical protein
VEIVKICYEVGDWEGLNSNIVLISKRRQQLKQVLVEIVQASLHERQLYFFSVSAAVVFSEGKRGSTLRLDLDRKQ